MEIDDLKQRYNDYSTEQLLELIVSLQSKIALLERTLFARKSERRHDDPEGMKNLFDEIESEAANESDEDSQEEEIKVGEHTRVRGKRKPLPAILPRVRREFDLTDAEKKCPHHRIDMVRIGESKTEQLDIIPAKIQVIENVTFSYKCPCCSKENTGDQIIESKLPAQPIPKSIAAPGLLAFIGVSKFMDALPLYRLERQFARIGVELSRTTMARWMIATAKLARPVWNLMLEELIASGVLCCDETPVQVLNEPNRSAEQKSCMWALLRPYGPQIIIYNYHTSRSAQAALDLLDDFAGILICDGLKSYNAAARKSRFTLAGCMAHIRRKFFDAEKSAKQENATAAKNRASKALDLIRRLYQIEKEVRDKSPEEILAARHEKSRPIMEDLKRWLDEEVTRVLPKSLLGKAVHYALEQWPKMQAFLENGLVPIDNNAAERCIRPFVIGRNNWLFSATTAGAESSAVLYSLVESAKANHLDPYDYLKTIFKELPAAQTVEDFADLMPHRIRLKHPVASYRAPH